MKVLLLAPHPFFIERGTPIDVDLMIRALSARGDRIDAVVYQAGQERSYPGLTVHRIPAPRWFGEVRAGFSLRKLICDVLMTVKGWRLLRQQHFDVIHAGEEAVFIALLFKWLFSVPYVYDLDSSIAQQIVDENRWLRPLAGIFSYFEKMAVRNSLAVAPVCRELADLTKRHGAKACVIVHDISQMSAEDFKDTGEIRRDLKLDNTILMYVGNLEPYQGVDLLLDAFQVLRSGGTDASLVIAGGPAGLIKRYQGKAAHLAVSDSVHFIGSWPVERLGELLAQADILVAPRVRGINTPMKVFPYLHSGRPVLVTDLPTHNQVLDDSVALLADATPEAFADGMRTLYDDPDLRLRLGEAGREFVERRHTYPAHQERVNELYEFVEDLIAGNPSETTVDRELGRRGGDD